MWLIASLNIPDFFKDKKYIHLKVLELEELAFNLDQVIQKACSAQGFIITSQEVPGIIKPILEKIPEGKPVFCSGPKTLQSMKEVYKGLYFLPKSYDQEGLVELISFHKYKKLFYPKAQSIRPHLMEALVEMGCQISTLDCYKTSHIVAKFDPLYDYQGIYFGSASCVESFYNIHKKLPSPLVYVPGHVTKSQVLKLFGDACEIKIIPF
jgi:uroporphyrinogen-III synthase